MNVLQIKVKEDGSLECSQDFKIMQGSYRNILLNVVVPHTLLLDPVIENNINLTGNNVRVGAIIRTASGKNLQTERYEFQWIKNFEQNNDKYSLYQRIMPKEFTMWDTVAQSNARGGVLQLVFNVVNWTKKTLSTGESTNVEQVVASPILDLQVYPSTYLNVEPIVDDDQLAILQSQTNDLSANVDRIDTDLDKEKLNIDDLQNRTGALETNVANIVKDTSKLKTDVSVLQEDSVQAKADIDELQGRTNVLEKDVSTLKTTTKKLGDEMSDLREDIINRPIFCGWFKNINELNELFPTATENDFAYIENGNVYQWKNGQWIDSAIPSPSSTTPISQTTGQETNVVMSQKAVTDELLNKVNKSQIVQTLGNSETNIMSQNAVTDIANSRAIARQIVLYPATNGKGYRVTLKFKSSNHYYLSNQQFYITAARHWSANGYQDRPVSVLLTLGTVQNNWIARCHVDYVYVYDKCMRIGNLRLNPEEAGTMLLDFETTIANADAPMRIEVTSFTGRDFEISMENREEISTYSLPTPTQSSISHGFVKANLTTNLTLVKEITTTAQGYFILNVTHNYNTDIPKELAVKIEGDNTLYYYKKYDNSASSPSNNVSLVASAKVNNGSKISIYASSNSNTWNNIYYDYCFLFLEVI